MRRVVVDTKTIAGLRLLQQQNGRVVSVVGLFVQQPQLLFLGEVYSLYLCNEGLLQLPSHALEVRLVASKSPGFLDFGAVKCLGVGPVDFLWDGMEAKVFLFFARWHDGAVLGLIEGEAVNALTFGWRVWISSVFL